VTGRLPLGVHLRGAALWVVWVTARDSLQARLRQLERDPYVHRDVVTQLRGVLADLELGARAYRDWELVRNVSDSAEVDSAGVGGGLEHPSQRWGDTSLAAASLDCSERWIRALIAQGRLVAAKRGRSWLVDLDSVEDFKRRGAYAA
jgi:excisionase family DNA binding protein